MKTTSARLLVFVKSFGFLLSTLLVASIALFYSVLYIFRGTLFGFQDAPIWITLYVRGANFIEFFDAPVTYLSSIALVSAIVGASWTGFIATRFSRLIWLQILIVPWIAVILTGPVWGLIWSVNHWPASSFGNHAVLMLFRKTDIVTGLSLSWLSAAQSFPLNLFSYVVFCGLLLANKKILLRNEKRKT
jgi:hypothetical protein